MSIISRSNIPVCIGTQDFGRSMQRMLPVQPYSADPELHSGDRIPGRLPGSLRRGKTAQRIIPPDVLAECRGLADAAEMRRKEEIRSTGAIIGLVALVTVWLLVAAGLSVLMARYISAEGAVAK